MHAAAMHADAGGDAPLDAEQDAGAMEVEPTWA